MIKYNQTNNNLKNKMIQNAKVLKNAYQMTQHLKISNFMSIINKFKMKIKDLSNLQKQKT